MSKTNRQEGGGVGGVVGGGGGWGWGGVGVWGGGGGGGGGGWLCWGFGGWVGVWQREGKEAIREGKKKKEKIPG